VHQFIFIIDFILSKIAELLLSEPAKWRARLLVRNSEILTTALKSV